jgi:thiamine kinase-like enzyme
VHGDAKLANFCFSDDDIKGATEIDDNLTNKITNKISRVAAVDFQYVGKGVGVKDLAYFLGSCLTDDDLAQLHNELLNYYFKALGQACNEYQPDINIVELEKEWRKLYPFANADFYRFLQGWSPEHHKINGYLKAQSDIALQGCF